MRRSLRAWWFCGATVYAGRHHDTAAAGRACGVSSRVVEAWRRQQVVVPSIVVRDECRYDVGDVAMLRVVVELTGSDLSVCEIRDLVLSLRLAELVRPSSVLIGTLVARLEMYGAVLALSSGASGYGGGFAITRTLVDRTARRLRRLHLLHA